MQSLVKLFHRTNFTVDNLIFNKKIMKLKKDERTYEARK